MVDPFFQKMASKILLVDNIDQLSPTGLSVGYMDFKHNNEYVTDELLIRDMTAFVNIILIAILSELNFSGLRSSISLSAYDDTELVNNIYKQLGIRYGTRISSLPLPIVIFIVKKIFNSRLTNDIRLELSDPEKIIYGNDVLLQWKNVETIGSEIDMISSLKGHVNSWKNLNTCRLDLIGVLSWSRLMQHRLSDINRQDFMSAIILEVNKCVENFTDFNMDIIKDLYLRFLSRNDTVLLPETREFTKPFKDLIGGSVNKKRSLSEEDEDEEENQEEKRSVKRQMQKPSQDLNSTNIETIDSEPEKLITPSGQDLVDLPDLSIEKIKEVTENPIATKTTTINEKKNEPNFEAIDNAIPKRDTDELVISNAASEATKAQKAAAERITFTAVAGTQKAMSHNSNVLSSNLRVMDSIDDKLVNGRRQTDLNKNYINNNSNHSHKSSSISNNNGNIRNRQLSPRQVSSQTRKSHTHTVDTYIPGKDEPIRQSESRRVRIIEPSRTLREAAIYSSSGSSGPSGSSSSIPLPLSSPSSYGHDYNTEYRFLPRGPGRAYAKPESFNMHPRFHWCSFCGMTHIRPSEHIFSHKGEFIGNERVAMIAIKVDQQLRDEGYTSD